MVAAKLHINIQQGLVDVEGDENFVRSVYEDFREYFATAKAQSHSPSKTPDLENSQDVTAPKSSSKSNSGKGRGKRNRVSEGQRSGWGGYTPQQSKEPDLDGLREFFSQYTTRSHAEKILIFVRFLSDEKGITPCSADQVFTCYRVLREKMPNAFIQAFRDTASKHGWINISSGPNSIETTIVGNNYFEHDLTKS